jgi:stage V sporulation protein AC
MISLNLKKFNIFINKKYAISKNYYKTLGCDYINKNQEYIKKAGTRVPKSNLFVNCCWAFFVGGAICTLAQALNDLYVYLGIHEETAKILVPITLIFLAALTTGLGWFDKLAKHAGAGTLVPITGFANSVVAPAVDTKNEGFILGLGAKIFTIAGPVILYGTLFSFIYGVIIWILDKFGIVI